MNRKELSQNHWKYYLMLEKRFVESIEFVELHEDNFDAFSNGYALLIQAIGAELDTVFKEFCGFNTAYGGGEWPLVRWPVATVRPEWPP